MKSFFCLRQKISNFVQLDYSLRVNVISAIPASIYSPKFYASLPKRSFWELFWYFIFITFLFVLGGALILAAPFLINSEETNLKIQNILTFYPEELVLTIQAGQASSNVPEPYFLKFEDLGLSENFMDQVSKDVPEEAFSTHFIVIDTRTAFSDAQFKAFDAVIWLSKDSLYVRKSNGIMEALPLSNIPDIVLYKEFVDEKMALFWEGIKTALPFFVLVLFLAILLGALVYRMLYLVLLAILVLLIASLLKLSLNYSATYKIAMVGITLSTFASLLLFFLNQWLPLYGFPFFSTLLALLVIVINLQKAKSLKLIR